MCAALPSGSTRCSSLTVLRGGPVGTDGMRWQTHALGDTQPGGSVSQAEWAEPVVLGRPVVAGAGRGQLVATRSRRDILPGGN